MQDEDTKQAAARADAAPLSLADRLAKVQCRYGSEGAGELYDKLLIIEAAFGVERVISRGGFSALTALLYGPEK